MRREIFAAVSVLLMLSLACRSEASSKTPNPLTLWSVAVTACGDGVLPGSIPDGRCTIGKNGDTALSVDVSLKDIFGTTYAHGITDPVTGETTLTGSLPEGSTPFVSCPKTVMTTDSNKHGQFINAPEEAVIVEQKGNSIRIEIPYQKPSPSNNNPSL